MSMWSEKFDLGFETWMLIARSRDYSTPIGMVWYMPHYIGEEAIVGFADIVECFVPEYARRKGVMTFLLDELCKDYPTLRTDKGTTDGLPFIKAYGFVEHPQFGWVFSGKKD